MHIEKSIGPLQYVERRVMFNVCATKESPPISDSALDSARVVTWLTRCVHFESKQHACEPPTFLPSFLS